MQVGFAKQARVVAFGLCSLALAGACTTVGAIEPPNHVSHVEGPTATTSTATAEQEKFEQDRQAILAMAGDFGVTFDFRETVSFQDGYKLKDKVSGAHEVVRVIEDRGDFISLQHILVAGPEPIKHWRQDWRYEPSSVLTFVGGNAWETREVPEAQRKGAWSQIVYQVDDAPRYGAVAKWTHENGASEWTPPSEWRPLPRRDATTRDDYHAINAINRHAITPEGWVHEQDNSKLILNEDTPRILVREIGVNTYRRVDSDDAHIAHDYWTATEGFWAGVRAEWEALEATGSFALTVQGEPEPVYLPILAIAKQVSTGELAAKDGLDEARAVIGAFSTRDIGTLAERLAAPPAQIALAE